MFSLSNHAFAQNTETSWIATHMACPSRRNDDTDLKAHDQNTSRCLLSVPKKTRRNQSGSTRTYTQCAATEGRDHTLKQLGGREGAVTSSGKAGFASALTELYMSARDAASEVPAACTVHCTVGIPEFLGWRPVWLTPKLGTTRSRERKTPKATKLREGGRVPSTTEESTETKPFPEFVFAPFRGVATLRVLQTLLRI